MCTGSCAKCLGGTLIPLAVLGFLANILLFFPGGKVINNNNNLSDEVWYFGGIIGSGVLVSTATLGALATLSSNGVLMDRDMFRSRQVPQHCRMKISASVSLPKPGLVVLTGHWVPKSLLPCNKTVFWSLKDQSRCFLANALT